MDTTEQKLAQALQREVHLQMSLDAERRCNESLRAERDALVAKVARLEELNWFCEEDARSLIADLAIAKQTKAPLVDPEAEAEQAKEAMWEKEQ